MKRTTAHAPGELVLQDASGGTSFFVEDACEGPDHRFDGPNPLERSVERLDRAGLAGTVESGKGAEHPVAKARSPILEGSVGTDT